MSQAVATADSSVKQYPRILQVAFACDPETSMETRIGWQRARLAAEHSDLTVLVGPNSNTKQLNLKAKEIGLANQLRFHQVDHSLKSKLLSQTATTYYLGLHAWHKSVYRVAKQLHKEQPFDLVHQTTYCGYREPGYGWKLGVPFIWGPVGGTQSFPSKYLSQLTPKAAWIEVCRNAINAWQLRYSRRVKKAISKSTNVISATQQAHDDLLRTQGIRTPVQIETALDFLPRCERSTRDTTQPIRILWAGRLKAWKCLPLLLKALAELPEETKFELRILGQGDQEQTWKRLARKLDLDSAKSGNRIEWLGWPEYRDTLKHYAWADAFVFTSMRDTSGTGLLEALAYGTPIIGVNHQGAADIMTDDCALKIDVESPQETITQIQQSIIRLSTELELWKRLSTGAIERSKQYTWDMQAESMREWYSEALSSLPSQATIHSSSEAESANKNWQTLPSVKQSNSQVLSS